MKPIKEYFDRKSGFFIIPEKRIAKIKSKFQNVELFSTKTYGKLLRIDNYFQTSEKDEFFYHEPLVQIPMFSHPNPKKVMIIGGGDGGSLEEVLKHKIVKKAVMIELDKAVVDFSKKHLKKINKNAFSDKRTELLIVDGKKFMENNKEKFDVIILDLTDPVGEASKLYTKEFYSLVKKNLSANGILSLHVECPLLWPNVFARIVKTLRSVFRHVEISHSFVPVYGTLISFGCCSDKINPLNVRKSEISKRIKQRKVKDLKFYDEENHFSLLVSPPYIKDILTKKHKIVTEKNLITEIEGGANYGKNK
jgi:spermidine synthase